MKKPKLLIIAYRAWGDWLYTCPIIPYLAEKYDLYLECNWKVYNLVSNDPRFKWVSYFLYERYPQHKWGQLFEERWKKLETDLKPDRVLNLNGSLEVECITQWLQPEHEWPLDKKRKVFGARNFYDAVFKRCQLDIPEKLKIDEIYYSQDEIDIVEKWHKRTKDKFKILMPMTGSTSQKVLHSWKEWSNYFVQRYPNAVVYLVGDHRCQKSVNDANITHPRIKNICGLDAPIKQIFLMTKYADYVIGPETGVVVSAGMWGVPKTMLCTTSSTYQCTKYHKNDHSIQSPMACSPCFSAIYHIEDCREMYGDLKKKIHYPACSKSFDIKRVVPFIDEQYKKKFSTV